uniref:RNA-directed DNA polymerase n=1 Tax=Rhipicephalus zambeziensis TaxID=60191 RepID=A0A224Z9X1_9ACAR
MANALPPFPSFDLRATDANNIGLEWTKWVERFQNFLVACNITSDTRKKALLLHYVGEEVYDLFQSLPASTLETTSEYEAAKAKLDAHFAPRINPTFAVYRFRQTKQNVGESLDAFYARLRQLARHCGFADADLEIKSQIILATSSSRLRKYAMLHSLNLPDLLKQGRMFEDVERDVYEIEKNDGNAAVLAVHKDGQHGHHQRDGRRPPRKSHERQRPRVSSTECHNCGGKWPHQGGRSGCPAWGKTCNACKKVGHFARFCLSTKKMVQAVDCDSSPNKNSQSVCSKKCSSTKGHSASFETGSSSDEYAFVAMTFPQAGSSPQAVVTVNNVPVTFIIDTGATVSIMGENDFKSCRLNVNLQATSIRVFPYKATSPLELLGKVAVTMRYRDKGIEEDIFIIPGNCAPLLSFAAASNLGLVYITYQVHEQLNDKSIVKAFPKLFSGVGKLKNQHIHLFVDKTVPPVAQPHRRIPFALRNATEKELERLLSEDIIEPAIGPTPWVSPVVIVPKPHQPDEIRICIDMRVVNTAIQRERHLCPTVDDIIVALNGATVFSNLDLKNGYHQLELDAPSRQLTTFSTHVGLFRYKRLNFGISSAAEIFQNTIRQVLNGIPNVLNVSDDILVFGQTKQEHDTSLEAVLQRLQEAGLTLNEKKCHFHQRELTFFGLIFSADGVRPDPKKIAAFLQIKTPESPQEVKSLLGMVNYSGRFLKNLADLTQPLRELTLKNATWEWTARHQKAFDSLKQAMSDASTLAYFDPSRPTELVVDASPHGLGAILVQREDTRTLVIAYASRALTPVESRYSQIEREMLAAVWGMEHFRLYLCGTKFLLLTDHKPLVSILGNPKSVPSARIQRLALRIQQYAFDVQHTAGSSNPSDYLSRHPVPFEKPGRQIDKVPDEYVHFVQRHCIPKSFSIEEVAEQTKMDPQLKLVKEAIHNLQEKWQTAELKPFAAIRTELATTPDGLILRGTRLVLPTNLQERAIQLAHRGHQGIIKTKQLLREKVWFPGMDKLVHTLIKGCLPCQAAVPQSSCEPLALTEPPNSPWEAVSVDFCGPFPDGKYAMVTVDDFSRYPVVHIISSTDARRVLPLLRAVFAQFGIPEQVRTDNGPPFQGAEFANFAEELGFRHHRVIPLWPQANGEVERFMRTLKKQVHTSQLENSDWKSELDTFLMSYRSTPQGTTKRTPYELLFGRPMRNLLPQYVPPLEATNKSGIRSTELRRKAYNKQYVDTRRHAKPHRFFVGQQVLCKQQQKNKFTPYYDPLPYVITNISGPQIVASRGGRVVVRNASFFKDASGIVSTSPHIAEPGCDDLAPLPNTEAQAPEPLQPHKHPCRRYPTRDRKRPGHFDDYV